MEKRVAPDWPAQLQKLWAGQIEWNSPMARRCTLRAGGTARALIVPAGRQELIDLVVVLTEIGAPWQVVGRGSNILVPDSGYGGVVILLGGKFSALTRMPGRDGDGVRVQVEAGCGLMRLVSWCADQGLSGLEFAVGIPGSVGGAVVMNAGAWGGEIAHCLDSVTLLAPSGELLTRARADLAVFYRRIDTGGMIVVEAGFLLAEGDSRIIAGRGRELLARRRAKQPRGVASAGSFFKNPPGMAAAGRLIEETGLKGARIGGAQVSPQHANFLVNTGGATAKDFLDLMALIQEAVEKQFGVRLEPEVHILPAL